MAKINGFEIDPVATEAQGTSELDPTGAIMANIKWVQGLPPYFKTEDDKKIRDLLNMRVYLANQFKLYMGLPDEDNSVSVNPSHCTDKDSVEVYLEQLRSKGFTIYFTKPFPKQEGAE